MKPQRIRCILPSTNTFLYLILAKQTFNLSMDTYYIHLKYILFIYYTHTRTYVYSHVYK